MAAIRNFSIPSDVPVEQWVLSIDEYLQSDRADEEERLPQPCIYIVPDFIRELNKKAFTPQVVSLGPFHNGAEALKPMEEYKQRALISFLRRYRKTLKYLMSRVSAIAPELQRCYDNLENKWRDVDKFTQLMVLDGCFVLGVVPIDATMGPLLLRFPNIQRDMLVLENQIPLKLLEVLLDAAEIEDVNVNDMILEFYDRSTEGVNVDALALHPLDLYRKSMIQEGRGRDLRGFETIGSATRLQEAGISFKKSDGPFLTNISFQKGVLYLPLLEVDDYTESCLLNMMAFEQFHHGCDAHVTGYVFFMDELIDTPKDVKLLENKGIIKSLYGSSDSVAKLFNEIGKEVTIHYGWNHENVRSLVSDHCKKKWNKHIALLKHDYFQSPWSLISLIGVIFVLLLTTTQTSYTILQYYHPQSPPPTPAPH